MDNFSTLVSIIIQAELHGEKHELKRVLDIGPTPQILIKKAGFEDLDMVVKASTICKICFDHGISTPNYSAASYYPGQAQSTL